MAGEQRAGTGAGRPARDARDDRDADDLGRGDEQDLRAARTGPGQPAAHVAVIAPQACRREHGEAEQQHGRVAAEDQQPFPGDAACRANRRDRAGRRGDREDVRALLELDCARSSRVPRLASSQSWIERGATGTIQP